MKTVCASASQLANLEPYDPKYLPAKAMLSANESPLDVPVQVREKIMEELGKLPFNRYPDPLATELRDAIAASYGLTRNQVLLGNGGDELLFDVALAWGGEGRRMLNVTPTFSVYGFNAELNNTEEVVVPRKADMSIDEDAVLARLAQGDISYVVITSPNNPTGEVARYEFIERVLNATDALVLVDEAYGEFADETVLPLLSEHENLLILHTFSKAYALAGVRMGYVLGSEQVIREFVKFRQPYSVDAVSQCIAKVVWENKDAFADTIAMIKQERSRVRQELEAISAVECVYPSDANFLFFKLSRAGEVWEKLYEYGVLIRDFSKNPASKDCLRVTIGTPEENDLFLQSLRKIVETM